jgi:hypothetical protein
MSTHHFLTLRQRLIDCRISLRAAKDAFELAKAEAEQEAFNSGRASGSNEAARQRSLTIALEQDGAYRTAHFNLRSAENELDRIEQLLEAARDERRASEWQIRARLADVLLGTGIPSDDSDPVGDSAFDDALLYNLDTQAALAAGR